MFWPWLPCPNTLTLLSIYALFYPSTDALAITAANDLNTTLLLPPRPNPKDYHCYPPEHASTSLQYYTCRGAAATFASTFPGSNERSLTHRSFRLPGEIRCPYRTHEFDCEFIVDYEADDRFYNPPISPPVVSDYGKGLARACVGPGRGSGGTLVVEENGLRGIWRLKFEIRRARTIEETDIVAV